jgi:hypothetical protein
MADELGSASKCRQRAAHCRLLAHTTTDDRVRELLHTMERMWSKLATETERLGALTREIVGEAQSVKAPRKETESAGRPAAANGSLSMISSDKPKSRLLAHAPQCPRCKNLMKVRTLLPGRKVDDVAYQCEDCDEQVVIAVPRER